MKNIRVFLLENFQFLEVKFSIYLNRHVFVMSTQYMSYPMFEQNFKILGTVHVVPEKSLAKHFIGEKRKLDK